MSLSSLRTKFLSRPAMRMDKLVPTKAPLWVPRVNGVPATLGANLKTGQYWRDGHSCTLAELIAVVRSGTGYQVDSTGLLSSFATNTLRRGSGVGAKIEEARTNSVRNAMMQGAVAGLLSTTGAMPANWTISYGTTGLTNANVTVGTVTTINGVTVLPLTINGTATGTSSVSVVIESSASSLYGQTWSGSYFDNVTGTYPRNNTLEIDELNSGGAFLSGGVLTYTPSATLTRQQISYTNVGPTAARERLQYKVNLTSGDVINATVNIGLPQLENNSSINSTVASAAVAAGGTMTGVTRTMYVFGGTGVTTVASMAATIAATAVTAVGSISAGSYSTAFPVSPAPLADAFFFGSISGTTLTISSLLAGTVAIGQTIGGAVSAATTILSGSGTTWTVSNSQTVTAQQLYSFAGTVAPTVNLTPTNNAALGFATSPIPTSTVAVTRNNDAATIVTPPAMSSFTLLTIAKPDAPATNGRAQNIIQLDAGDDTQRTLIRRQVTGLILCGSVGGSGAQPNPSGTWAQSTSGKVAGSFVAGSQIGVFNGGTPVTTSGASLPTTPTNVRLGSNGSGTEQFNGNLEEFWLWANTVATSAELVRITT